MTADRDDVVLVAVNLDPHDAQGCNFEVPLWEFGLPDDAAIEVEDLVTRQRASRWHGQDPASSGSTRTSRSLRRSGGSSPPGEERGMRHDARKRLETSPRPRRTAMIDRQRPLWYKDAIIYQLHVKAFFDANDDGIGDFEGLIAEARLHPGSSASPRSGCCRSILAAARRRLRHRRLPRRSTRPTARCEDFKAFVGEAHRRGLRVITELVINHTSDQHPWFQRARARQARLGRARLLRLERHRPEVTATPASSSSTPRSRTGPGTRWRRPITGIASTRHQPDLNFDNPRVLRGGRSRCCASGSTWASTGCGSTPCPI